jgi:hypothetical protein
MEIIINLRSKRDKSLDNNISDDAINRIISRNKITEVKKKDIPDPLGPHYRVFFEIVHGKLELVDQINWNGLREFAPRLNFDKVNVHGKENISAYDKKIKELMKIPASLNINDTIKDIYKELQTLKSHPYVLKMKNKNFLDFNPFGLKACKDLNYGYGDKYVSFQVQQLKAEDKVNVCDIIIRIWGIICEIKDEEKRIELIKIFVENTNELTKFSGICSTGWAGRLINVLDGHVVEEGEIECTFNPIEVKKEIKQKVNLLIQKYMDEEDEKTSDVLMDGMIGSDQDSMMFYKKWLKEKKEVMMKEIINDYKGNKNIKVVDIENLFDQVIKEFIKSYSPTPKKK